MRDQSDGRFDAKRARNSPKGKEEEEPTPSHLSCGKRKERGKGAETFDENRARTFEPLLIKEEEDREETTPSSLPCGKRKDDSQGDDTFYAESTQLYL